MFPTGNLVYVIVSFTSEDTEALFTEEQRTQRIFLQRILFLFVFPLCLSVVKIFR